MSRFPYAHKKSALDKFEFKGIFTKTSKNQEVNFVAKTRRVIQDAEKSVSVSQEQVEIAAKKIKENRLAGTRRIKNRAPVLRQMRSS